MDNSHLQSRFRRSSAVLLPTQRRWACPSLSSLSTSRSRLPSIKQNSAQQPKPRVSQCHRDRADQEARQGHQDNLEQLKRVVSSLLHQDRQSQRRWLLPSFFAVKI